MAHNLRRTGDGRVSFAELFYDLVFVFAITQISQFLLVNLTFQGAFQTAFLFLSVWWIWIYSTWVFNWLDPEKFWVRVLLFVMMTGGLFLSMALPEAFGSRGAVFGITFAMLQVSRTLFVSLVASGDPGVRRTFLRITFWVGLAGVFWIWGGLAAPADRVVPWLVALSIELIAPAFGYPFPGHRHDPAAGWSINGGHLAERCGLFVIICLGEALLVSGATFARMDWDMAGVITFLSAVLVAIGMWWIYFHIGHKRGTHQIEHSDNPGALGRLAYSYLHIPIVAGIVLGAVASERAIAHPHDPAHWPHIAVTYAGLALYLLGNGLFKWVSAPYFPLSHLIGLALCLGLIWPSYGQELRTVNVAAAAILVLVAIWEDVSLNRATRKSARKGKSSARA